MDMDTERLFRITRIPSNIKIPDVWIDMDHVGAEEQFALAWAFLSPDKMNVVGISTTEGHDTLRKLVALTGRSDLSDKLRPGSDIVKEVQLHHRRNPLYILALGAASRVAAAMEQDPNAMGIHAVTFWLGGNAFDFPHTHEANMLRDIQAARMLFDREVYLCQIPREGALESLATTEPELREWILGQNSLGNYLYNLALQDMPSGTPWSRTLWDLGAVAALTSRETNQYTVSRMETTPLLREDFLYARDRSRHAMRYVYAVKRDAIFGDLFGRIRALGKEASDKT